MTDDDRIQVFLEAARKGYQAVGMDTMPLSTNMLLAAVLGSACLELIKRDEVGQDATSSLSEDDALYGAAWKVCYERLDPDGCSTPELRSVLAGKAGAIREWSATQAPDVKFAYGRAAADVATRADQVLENNERARRMSVAFAAIPRPPAL